MSFTSRLLVLLTLTSQALSWGSLGHRTTVALSLLYIPPYHPAHTLLTNLLHGQDPTTAALFPDKIRYIPSFAYTAPWHYIDARDNPPHQCGINLTRDCLSEGCVVTAIANHTSRVADPDLPFWERGQSLRFMMHFFGDVHQPLHTENMDRGGNGIDVHFDGVRHNLHSVWDTLIPRKIVALGSEKEYNETEAAYKWAGFLMARYGNDDRIAESINHVCVHDAVECSLGWADQANRWVCDYVLKDGLDTVKTMDLGGEYFDGAVPIIEEMIVKGGRRLARWLMVIARDLEETGMLGSTTDMAVQEL